ncbi:polygalacturonase-like [Lycium ferocissimum]|uniref:polygalacturonase-like n=1 Tax=Lycium ferocissimum TaxID=112874 RepID=UPI0028165FD0|nr:polygalacturonase-like [Lycium ferocissimum]
MAKFLISWCCVFFSFGFIFLNSNAASVTYNVLSFGAKSDGKSDATQPFLKAWVAACSSVKSATIYVPSGRYLIKAATFRGPCKNKITVKIDGTLVAPSDYYALGNSGYWILFIQVNRITVQGGTLDGNGAGFWACRKSGKNCPVGARSITFNWANDVVVSGLTSINSQQMHLVINSCKNVMVKNVRIIAPDLSPNTDGIHVQSSTGVTITGTSIKTGDDCISVGPGTRNLWMEKIQCGPGHGVSIGSLARDYNEDGVQNVTLINSAFTGSDNGLRIKSWARASTGFVTNINYQNIMMKNVDNPIIIDQNYCPNNQGCPGQTSGIKINQVTYQNILGTSATQVAMRFDCSPSNPCSRIKLQDIKLTYLNNKKAQSLCKNIRGNTGGVILPDNCLL